MTHEEAEALEQFIKDHDTRFQAKAMTDEPEGYVLLTGLEDRREIDRIHRTDEFHARYIAAGSPGPTIEGRWHEWIGGRAK